MRTPFFRIFAEQFRANQNHAGAYESGGTVQNLGHYQPALSPVVAYEVSLVEIAPTLPPPVNGGIVTSIGLTVFPLSPPLLSSLEPSVGALVRVDAGGVLHANTLVVHGSGFALLGQHRRQPSAVSLRRFKQRRRRPRLRSP